MRALRDGRSFTYDQEPPPADGGRSTALAIVGEPVVDVEELVVREASAAAGTAPPAAPREQLQCLYVLDGELSSPPASAGCAPPRARGSRCRRASPASSPSPRRRASSSCALPGRPMAPDGPAPFAIDVPAAVLEDLDWRLRRARWPDELLLAGGEDAARLAHVRRLLERWRSSFDWRAYERRLNALPQHRVVVDGIGLHVVWARSDRPAARPLLLLNGWPSSFVEFEPVVARLTAPAEGPAFDVVIPTRPGYGFSDRALDRAGDDDAVADLFAALMREHLGYDAFLVHGDDFGGSIASRIAWRHPGAVAALHVAEWLEPDVDAASATVEERRYLDALADWRGRERAYGAIAATRPQTLGLALDDSPLGLLAWIADKFLSWTDARADGELPIPPISCSPPPRSTGRRRPWPPRCARTPRTAHRSAPASGSPYRRPSSRRARAGPRRREAGSSGPTPTCARYTVRARGGHFLAAEDPDAFVAELRAFFGGLAAP